MNRFGKIGARRMVKNWTARDYVQDGLIAMWDGIENAGWGVHDPNATVWKDLCGTKDLALTSASSWTPKGAYGNGSNYIAGLTGADNAIALENCKTIQIVFSWNKQFVSGKSCAFIFSNAIDDWGRTIFADNQLAPVGIKGGRSISGIYGPTIPFENYTTNSIALITAIYSSNTLTNPSPFMLNDRAYTSRGQNNRSAQRGLVLGGNTWQYNLIGEIFDVRIYSRALTADEIAANYAIDKLRFNLP